MHISELVAAILKKWRHAPLKCVFRWGPPLILLSTLYSTHVPILLLLSQCEQSTTFYVLRSCTTIKMVGVDSVDMMAVVTIKRSASSLVWRTSQQLINILEDFGTTLWWTFVSSVGIPRTHPSSATLSSHLGNWIQFPFSYMTLQKPHMPGHTSWQHNHNIWHTSRLDGNTLGLWN